MRIFTKSHAANNSRSLAVCALVMLLASTAAAQTSYTFTSGFNGDGFQWPESPTGLLDGEYFYTPDGIAFYNYIGNNLFFDSQYQVIGNAPGISGDAMWGNPLDLGYGTVDVLFWSSPVQTVGFDFAWSVAGSPDATPDYVEVYLQDSEGRATYYYMSLWETFTGFGGFDGYAGRLDFEAINLSDDYNNVDGGPFVDIEILYIYLYPIMTGGPASEFGIDNFDTDGGSGGGGGELFPSVNGGAVDITGGGLLSTALRGVGVHGIGLEVTNGTSSDTTYSTELLPNGMLNDAGQVNNAFIAAGQSIYTPNLATVSRSLSPGEYSRWIRVINNGDPSDPDNEVELIIRLVEPPSLTIFSPVDVSAGEKVQLSNAAAPVNNFRASVKVTSTSISGPFNVSGFSNGAPVKPGQTLQGVPTLNRFGLLSGPYSGTFTALLQMAYFTGINSDIEVFLHYPEPVPAASWTLNAVLTDTLTDTLAYGPSNLLGPGKVGVNSVWTAGTLAGGMANATGSVTLSLASAPGGATTGVAGQAVETNFTTSVPAHVVQITYRDQDICPAATEGNLRLLYLDSTGTPDWYLAVNGNSGGSATFFSGSFENFAATLGGSPLSSALGTHGLDTTNNRAWAIVNHEALFGVGQIGQTCRVAPDLDWDGDVDQDDLDIFQACASGPAIPYAPGCADRDFDSDGDVDQSDFGMFQRCFSGEDLPPSPGCAD